MSDYITYFRETSLKEDYNNININNLHKGLIRWRRKEVYLWL